MKKTYRPNVAFLLGCKIEGAEKFLVGERSDAPGSWQFPQGGAKPGEPLEKALRREVLEEISLPPESYEVLKRFGPYRYLFPEGRTKEGYAGQEQTYFLARLLDRSRAVDSAVESPEFSRLRWIEPGEFRAAWVAPFKREVYRQVFRDVWGISLV